MLSATGNSSGMVPPNSRMVCRTLAPTSRESTLLFNAFVRQLLPARLDGEIGLAMRHDFFAGIGVLNDEVTGIAGETSSYNGSFRTTPEGDHFADVSKMVFDAMPAVETGQFGLLDHGLEVPVLGIFQNVRQPPTLCQSGNSRRVLD